MRRRPEYGHVRSPTVHDSVTASSVVGSTATTAPLRGRASAFRNDVRRIVVHGETLPFEYLGLMVDPRDPGLFSSERVPVE